MYHIEITQDNKNIFSGDFSDCKIRQSRKCVALYKKGENKPFTIAPSCFVQTFITMEENIIPDSDIITNDREMII